MKNTSKFALMITTALCVGSLAPALQAQTTVTLNEPTTSVVGVTTEGDLVVEKSVYVIVQTEMTPEEILAVNAETGLAAGPSPGLYAGWKVTSSDKQDLGVLSYSVQNEDGVIHDMILLMHDGRSMRLTNGIAVMGEGTIELRITKAEVLAAQVAQFTNITVN